MLNDIFHIAILQYCIYSIFLKIIRHILFYKTVLAVNSWMRALVAIRLASLPNFLIDPAVVDPAI